MQVTQVEEEPLWELSEEMALWGAVGTPGDKYRTQSHCTRLIDSDISQDNHCFWQHFPEGNTV